MIRRPASLLLAAALGALAPAAAAQSAQDLYDRAYVLENEAGDHAGAERLYTRILDSGNASPDLRARVEERLAVCREEVASEDFAGLLPENPLLYVELNRPGDQLEALLDELGLLQMARAAGQEGSGHGISPALVQGLLGMRGGAVALTGVNPSNGQPTGVAVLHPGDLDFVRGLIETALPNGGVPAGTVEGYPTYSLEENGFVTLTARLVVASTHKREIQRVLERLNGEEKDSLAGNALLTEAMGDRSTALLTFCVNPAPLVPLAKMAAAQDPEAAAWMSVCDPSSLQTVVGRLGVRDGLSLDLTLNMSEGHENLAYHFLRMPPIQSATLDRIPAGAAGFLAASLNPARSYETHAEGRPWVSFMDFGRELFGNVASFALYALPSEEPGAVLPRVGAVVTVNDPEKTRQLWSTVLGVASLSAGGSGEFGGEEVEVAGIAARRFALPEGLSLYGAVAGSELHLACEPSTLAAALETRSGAPSVRRDEALSGALARVRGDSTLALVVHAGRALSIARDHAPGADAEEMAQLAPHVEKTTAALVLSHGADALRLSVGVGSLPKVGELVSLHRARRADGAHGGTDTRERADDSDADGETVVRVDASDLDGLVAAFDRLAEGGEREAALAVFEHVWPHVSDDARWLNNFAWGLLTEDRYRGDYAALALRLSERSNDLTSHGNWAYVDTLAVAEFETGDVQRAIDLGKKALALVGDGDSRAALEASLARFTAER